MKNIFRIAGLLVLIVALGLVWQLGLFEYLTVENLRELESDLGPWAIVAFVVAFVVGELIQVPSVFWVLCAGLIWPIWVSLPLSLFAALLAATVAFLVARYILGDRFHERLPKQLEGLKNKLVETPFKAVVMIRLTTFLHPIVHWVLAASPIKLPVFLVGTAIGILPGVVAIILLGQTFVNWWDEYSIWIVLALIIGFVLFAWYRRSGNDGGKAQG